MFCEMGIYMNEMYAAARLQEDMRFAIDTGSGHTVTVNMLDDMAPGTTGVGSSPMELLLVALAGCTGISVLSILRKRKQDITGYDTLLEIRLFGVCLIVCLCSPTFVNTKSVL